MRNGATGNVAASGLSLALPAELVESIARRAAALVIEAQNDAVFGQPRGFLDVGGAAAFLACPKSRIYALVSAGRIPHHRDGSRLLFEPAELREWVREGGAKRP